MLATEQIIPTAVARLQTTANDVAKNFEESKDGDNSTEVRR